MDAMTFNLLCEPSTLRLNQTLQMCCQTGPQRTDARPTMPCHGIEFSFCFHKHNVFSMPRTQPNVKNSTYLFT